MLYFKFHLSISAGSACAGRTPGCDDICFRHFIDHRSDTCAMGAPAMMIGVSACCMPSGKMFIAFELVGIKHQRFAPSLDTAEQRSG
jgi:hypothetical protein